MRARRAGSLEDYAFGSELADVAREIEARRTGVYVLSYDEKAALEEARRSPVASDEEVAALWKRLGIA